MDKEEILVTIPNHNQTINVCDMIILFGHVHSMYIFYYIIIEVSLLNIITFDHFIFSYIDKEVITMNNHILPFTDFIVIA